MKSIVEINETNFETEVLQSSIPVLVDFWAEWCGPCKMLAPVLGEIAEENEGRVKIAKVNVETQPGLAARYHVQAMPTLPFFVDGKVHSQILGAVSKKTILARFDEIRTADRR